MVYWWIPAVFETVCNFYLLLGFQYSTVINAPYWLSNCSCTKSLFEPEQHTSVWAYSLLPAFFLVWTQMFSQSLWCFSIPSETPWEFLLPLNSYRDRSNFRSPGFSQQIPLIIWYLLLISVAGMSSWIPVPVELSTSGSQKAEYFFWPTAGVGQSPGHRRQL